MFHEQSDFPWCTGINNIHLAICKYHLNTSGEGHTNCPWHNQDKLKKSAKLGHSTLSKHIHIDIKHFNLSWLVLVKWEETAWLVSQPPPLSCYCTHHAHFSQAPSITQRHWLLSHFKEWDSPSTIYCISFFQKMCLSLKTNFRTFYACWGNFIFLLLIFRKFLEPKTASLLYWQRTQMFVTAVLFLINDRHSDFTLHTCSH
jgi:hypothetical protein